LAGGLTLGLIAFGIVGGWFELDLEKNALRLGFIATLLALTGLTIHLHRTGSRFANAGKVVLAFVGLCAFIHYLSNMFPDESLIDRLLAQERPSVFETVAYNFGLTWATLATAVSVLAMTFLLKRLFGEDPSTPGAPSDAGKRSRWLLTLGILLMWGIVETLFGSVLPSVTSKLRDLEVIEYVPFLVVLLLTASLRKERWVVDGEGVKFLLGNRSIFCAKWRRIQQIVVIHRANGKETFIVHYRTRFLIPFSVVFRPESVLGGEAMADLIRGSAMEEGLKVVHFRASRTVVLAGWTLILAGCALIPFRYWLENDLHLQYVDGRFNAANYAEFAAVLPLSLFYLANIALLSLGFGLNSGARFGGSRIFLLTIWMAGLAYLETPALHWLVWIAIYSIETAIMTPHTVLPALQYPPLLEFGFDVATWGFALAPIFFWIGVAAGRRRWRPQEEPLPIATAQTTEEREEPMLVAS